MSSELRRALTIAALVLVALLLLVYFVLPALRVLVRIAGFIALVFLGYSLYKSLKK